MKAPGTVVQMRFPAPSDRAYSGDSHWYPALVIRSNPGTVGELLNLAVFVDPEVVLPHPRGGSYIGGGEPVLTCVDVEAFDSNHPNRGGWRWPVDQP